MAERVPMPMCPMAETCKGLMDKPRRGVGLIIPGLLLIALGVVVLIEPRILVWLVAAVFVLMGLMMLFLARFMRTVAARMRDAPGQVG
jgi:uncharacterized membrane protein HdeD (DUF308 family)